MLKKISIFLSKNIFPFLILLICGILAWKNYDRGTFLLGWDSLHSEFNFKDSFYRAISGAWREDQGFGAVAIHSHMADLPRIIFSWLTSFVLPLNLVRYSYIFLCMVLGPLGMYLFLKYIFDREHKGFLTNVAAFLGSIYYLLNLGTLQHFYVVFEMFTAQFAFLPWLFLYTIKYLNDRKRSSLIIFSIITLLASPMAYAATLFYAYFAGLLVFLTSYVFFNKQKFKNIKTSFVILATTLLINSYWLLPNLYSVVTQSGIVSNSRINTLFSPEAFLRNRSYGDLADILINKSFLFGWNAFDFNANKYSELMKPWIDHLNDMKVIWIGYSIVAIYIFGFVLSMIKRNKIGLSFVGVTLLSLFFLFNENFITSGIFKFLYDNYGIFSEGFRMPFTKFSILYIFSTTFYFSYLLFEFFKLLNKYLIGRVANILVQVTIFMAIILYMLPAFKGNFISSVVKTELPPEYTKVFSWFNSNNNDRVAVLPLNSLWGWENHDWKYEGSGFLSFGIKNPLLIRDFDRWSPYNETFFNQASIALYDNDEVSFINILEKYKVKYLLLDESIINPGQDKETLKYQETKDLLNTLGFVESFKSGFLTVYDTGITTENVSVLNSYTPINEDLTYSKFDPVYEKYGNYIQDNNALTLPFVNFDTRGEVKFEIEDDKLQIINKAKNVKATLPISERVIEDFDKSHGYPETTNCDLMKTGNVIRTLSSFSRTYRAENGGVACDYFVYNQLKYNTSYVIHIKGQNKEGRSLKIYLYNWESKRVELEELLPTGDFDSYFVIYPKTNSDLETQLGSRTSSGYTLNVETRSFGRIASENIIEKIEFVPFNIKAVQDLQIDSDAIDKTIQTNNLQINNVKKYGTAIYRVETTGSGVIELGQGYENGWTALAISRSPLAISQLEHLKVNSWSNGFVVKANSQQPMTIDVFFWPQFLEWGGFLILLLTFFFIIVKSKK